MCQISQDDLKAQADCYAVLHQFTLFSQHNASLAGLSAEQYHCLLAIQGFEYQNAPTIDQLTPLLFLESSEVLALIEQLITAELIGITETITEPPTFSFKLTHQGEIVLADIAKKDEIALEQLQLSLLGIN